MNDLNSMQAPNAMNTNWNRELRPKGHLRKKKNETDDEAEFEYEVAPPSDKKTVNMDFDDDFLWVMMDGGRRLAMVEYPLEMDEI